ncbi:hypothetical protein [Haliscomenobacter sp.]|uniref:hypothetical protein n=1 Tax=Haliscomenobacter sp. TaxID=2717303 RepID=UPI0035942E8B
MNHTPINWINTIATIATFAPDYHIIQESADGNPLLRVQVGEQRIRIIQELESDFSFWIERFEGPDGSSGDELVLDVGRSAEQQRLAGNVLEAFVKRRRV